MIQKILFIIRSEGIKSIFVRPYKALIRVINHFLIFVFYIFPIEADKILLESQGDYTDNVRAFSDYLQLKSISEFDVYWLVQNPKEYRGKYKGKFLSRNEFCINFVADYHIATAKYFIFSHPYWLKKWRKEQTVINTTHSVAQLKGSSNNGANKLYNYVLTCSDYCTEIRKKTFFDNCNDHFLCLGQPRLDLMFEHKDCSSILFRSHNEHKMILCMETFKRTKTWDDGGSKDKFAINVISSRKEIEDLDRFLGDHDMYLVVKIHHLQDMSMIEDVNLSNIVYLKDADLACHDIQVNQLLENADVLLTDYSSVFYDYLLTDRPIGFLIGDMNDYKRGFMMDNPLGEMPGEIIESMTDLFAFLNDCHQGTDRYEKERKVISDKVFKYKDSNNSQRLLNWIIENSKKTYKMCLEEDRNDNWLHNRSI